MADPVNDSTTMHGTVRVGPMIRSAYSEFLVFLFSGKQGVEKFLCFNDRGATVCCFTNLFD